MSISSTRHFRWAVAALSLASAIPALAQSTDNRNNRPEHARQNDQRQKGELEKASKLIGYSVQTEDGQNSGTIQNLGVDLDRARPFYVIVKTDGVQGLNQDLIAVPFKACQFKHNQQTCKLNVNMERLKDAPEFDPAGWNSIGDQRWGRIVHEFFAVSWPGGGGTEQARLEIAPAKDMIQAKALDRDRQEVGQCQDVLIDTDRALAPAALIELDRNKGDDRLVAVPLQIVDFNQGQRALTVNVDRQKLADAPRFSSNDLQSTRWLPDVYAFFNVDDTAYGYAPPDRDRGR